MTSVNYQKINKPEVVEMHKEAENKILEQSEELLKREQELEEKSKEVDTLRDEMSELKNMLLTFLSSNNQQHQQVVINKEEDIMVGCTGNKKIVVHADGKEIEFMPDGLYVPLTRNEVNSLMKSRYKNLFINGLLRFEDKEQYENFRVYPIIDLSEQGLIDLFEKEPEEIISIIKDAQNKSPRPFSITYSIMYGVGAMLVDGKITFDMNKVLPLEKFLKADIRGKVMNDVKLAREIGYYKR